MLVGNNMVRLQKLVGSNPVKRFPTTSLAMITAIQKVRNQAKPKSHDWEKTIFATPVREVQFDTVIY